MIGGAGVRHLRIQRRDGHDIVTDFTTSGPEADRIRPSGTELHSFADVVVHASFDAGTGTTTITHNGAESIVLNGVALANLTASEFLLS